MNRFNHLSSPLERLVGVPLPATLAEDIRGYAPWIAAALACIAFVWAVQEARLKHEDDEGASLAARIAAQRVAVARVRHAQTEVTRLHAVESALRALRRSGTARANEIATIGNVLPADSWLTSVRFGPSAVALDGRSRGLRGVAAALAGLSTLADYASLRLLSTRNDPTRSAVTYSIELVRR